MLYVVCVCLHEYFARVKVFIFKILVKDKKIHVLSKNKKVNENLADVLELLLLTKKMIKQLLLHLGVM